LPLRRSSKVELRDDPIPNPYKFNDEVKAKFCEHIANGLRPSQACIAVNINRDTYEEHYNRDPKFRDMLARAEEDSIDKVENALFEAATEKKDVNAIKYFLNNRRISRWVDTKNLKLDAEINGEVEYIIKWADDISDRKPESEEEDNLPASTVSDPTRNRKGRDEI
jgi:hypothetical protein